MENKALRPLPIMRLLMLSPGRIASTQILDIVFTGLADQGAVLYCALYDNAPSFSEQKEVVRESDIIFLFRSYTPESLSLLRFAKECGKIVIYSTDDDFRELNPNTPLGRVHLHPDNLSAYESLFREADLVWLFTEEMKRRYKPLNSKVVIGRLPSFVELNRPDVLDAIEADNEQDCVIGYGGSSHHHADWQLLVRPLLKVLDSYRHVRVEFVNYAPEELSCHPKARVLPLFEDLPAYYEFLRKARWSIGLAPLADTLFNRGKTNNKYREYAGLGIPGIYSDMPVYSSCVRHGETGYLTPHSEDRFYEALRAMIENPSLRSKIRRGALQDASSTYALRGVQLQLLQEISLLAISKRYKGWKKPTLLAVGFDRSSSTHIDALQPCRRLEQQGLLRFSWVQPADLTDQHFDGVDGVYVVRAFQPETLPLLEWACRKNVPLISSWDDDFLSIPAGTPLGDYYRHPSVVHAIKRFLAESSLVIASTPPLVARSLEFNWHVLESLYGLDSTGLSAITEQSPLSALADGRVCIGFYGANTGIGEPWIVDALRRLRDRYGARIVLEVIGSTPPSNLREVVDWCGDAPLPYEESLQLLRSRGWDIGLAPLANTMFNTAKQATKFRDYAWAGAAIVCSKVPAYDRALIDGIHCLFAQNTVRAWEEAIASLIDDPSRAAFLRQGAKKLLEAVHVQEITNATWQQLIWRIGVAAAMKSSPPASGEGLLSRYVGSLESNHAQVFAGGAERLPKASPTAFSSSEIIKNVSNPPLVYVPLAGALRYCLTPRLPRWKGIEVFLGTPFEEVKGRLAFQICLENGLAIREGETPFEARNQASWVTLEFPELHNAGGQSFILTLRLQEPRRTKIGIFETQHTRSLVRRAAYRLGVSQVGHNLFCRLVYT